MAPRRYWPLYGVLNQTSRNKEAIKLVVQSLFYVIGFLILLGAMHCSQYRWTPENQPGVIKTKQHPQGPALRRAFLFSVTVLVLSFIRDSKACLAIIVSSVRSLRLEQNRE